MKPNSLAVHLSVLGGAMVLMLAVFGFAFFSGTAPATATPADTITISNASGVAQTNYPLQFARPFLQGEFPNGKYPQVVYGGTPLSTQVDVKERWSDGSVKHAVLATILPTIPATGSTLITFAQQSSGNNTALTKTQMLGSNFDFDAVISIATSSQTASASARAMLQADKYTLWTAGSIAQTVMLADDSAARAYDMGFDSLKSIRPRFYATFWPTLNKVTVRVAAENANTETFQDVMYNLTIKTGSASPTVVYTKQNVPHYIASAWTKVFWLGGTPEQKINIDNNLSYLKETKFFPNYDTSFTIADSVIASDYTNGYNAWNKVAHADVYDAGWWTKYMPTTGGRSDIGLLPKWTVQWLYTGDWRTREMALTMADLAGAWPMQVREGDSAKKYDKAQTVSALGKPLSVFARPTLWIFDDRGPGTAEDAITTQGARIITDPSLYPATNGGWSRDNAHQPDPFSAQYVLSGDPWYLNELQMWAGYDSLSNCPGDASWCRGNSDAIYDELRGEAWHLRARTNAAALSPDGTPEKTYFTDILNSALAEWEGLYNITNGNFYGTAAWNWGRTTGSANLINKEPPQLHWWHSGHLGPWQNDFLIMSLGRTVEQGFTQAQPLFSWAAQFVNGAVNDSNPLAAYLLGSYYLPDPTTANFPTWTAVINAYAAADSTKTAAQIKKDFEDGRYGGGYSNLAAAAAAFTASEPGGSTAWNFMKTNVVDVMKAANTTDPQWAFVPRSVNTTTPAPFVFLSANPESLTPSNSAVLTWSSSNATACTGTGFSTGGATSGSITLSPTVSTTYSISCTGAGGTGSGSASVFVGALPTVSLSATPSAIVTGQSTTLAWSSTNATSCTGNGFSATGVSGSVTVSPTQSTDYSVTCTSGGGSKTASASVTVSSTPPPSATPDLVGTAGDDTLTVNDGSHIVDGLEGYNIAVIVAPGQYCNYSSYYLMTTNADGSITMSEQHCSGYSITLSHIQEIRFADGVVKMTGIPVVAAPTPAPTATLSASPVSISSGQNATLSWSSTDADSCTGSGFSTGSATSGSAAVTPTANTTYSLVCAGKGGSASASASVTVTTPTPPAGDVTSVTSVTVSGDFSQTNNCSTVADGSSCTVSLYFSPTASGVRTGTLTVVDSKNGSHTVMLSGTGVAQVATTTPISTTTPVTPASPTVSFSASATSTTAGQTVTLSWSSTNATSCAGTGFSTGSATSGSVAVSPAQSTNYSVACTGSGGSKTADVSVTVSTAPKADLVGTAGDDTLTVVDGIHTVDGLGGYNIAVIVAPGEYCNYARYFLQTVNADGSITMSEQHCSGYTITLSHIQEIRFADGVIQKTGMPVISAASSGFAKFVRSIVSAVRDIVLAPVRVIKTALGIRSSMSAAAILSAQSMDFGSVTVGSVSSAQTVTFTYKADTVTPTPTPTPTPDPAVTLVADRTNITAGDTVKLTWAATNATACTANFSTGGALSGTTSVKPTVSISYSITCTGNSKSAVVSVPVTVNAAPVTCKVALPRSNESLGPCGSGYTCRGSRVSTLQKMLNNDLGTNVDVSGYYGNLTTTAVEQFQCKYNIVCTGTPSSKYSRSTGFGIVGPKTLQKLREIQQCGATTANATVSNY